MPFFKCIHAFNKKKFLKKTSVTFQLSTLFATARIFCNWDLKTNH